MTLVAGNLRSSLSVRCRGEARTVEPGEPISLVRFELPDSSTRVSLTVSGYADLYGVLLDGKTGVRMDNMAMRGSSGAIFTTMDAEQLRLLQSHAYQEHHSGLGLKNVDQRIRLYCGEEYGLSFESAPGQGTTVTVTLPADGLPEQPKEARE